MRGKSKALHDVHFGFPFEYVIVKSKLNSSTTTRGAFYRLRRASMRGPLEPDSDYADVGKWASAPFILWLQLPIVFSGAAFNLIKGVFQYGECSIDDCGFR